MPADKDLKEQNVELVLKEPAQPNADTKLTGGDDTDGGAEADTAANALADAAVDALADPSVSKWARPGSSPSVQESKASGALTDSEREDLEFPVPRLPAQYQVLKTLGQGGMGSVYKVFDSTLQKALAIKVIKPELSTDQAALRRFEQESLALSELNHPNIVAVFASGKTDNGAPYMVMDFIEGETLSQTLEQRGPIGEKRALPLFIEICDALHYAHQKHIIHRDLKPSNIIFARSDNGSESARVVDFGIAKVLRKASGETVTGLTQVGDFFGTPAYMSPEQCEGAQLDARSDIYSFGCVMYETLTGAPPFTEKNPFKLMTKHVEERPALIAASKATPDLALVVAKCLEKKQEDRYSNVDQLMTDLVLIRDGKRPKNLSKGLSKLQIAGLIAVPLCALSLMVYLLVPVNGNSVVRSNPVAQILGYETVPAIEVKVKPSIAKPVPVALAAVPAPPDVPFEGPPLDTDEKAQLRKLLLQVTLTNQDTLKPVLKMGKRALPELLDLVQSDDAGLAKASATILTKYPKQALPKLVEIFKTNKGRFVSDAIEQSGGAGMKALSHLVSDPDADVRTRALNGITDSSRTTSQNVSNLVSDVLLEDVSEESRAAAARALHHSESPRAKQALKYALLNDPSALVRRGAGSALSNIADSEGDTSKETLEVIGWTIQHDPDQQVAQGLIRGTRNLKKDLLPYFRAAFQSGSEAVKSAVLSQGWDRESGEALLPELVDALSDEKLSFTATYNLQNLGPRARPALPRMHQLDMQYTLDRNKEYQQRQLQKAIEAIEL